MDNQNYEHVTLSTLGNGSLEERFQEELQKVLGNIQDPNTKPNDNRKITMTVTIKPTEDRDQANIMIGVSSSLASYKQVNTAVFLATEKDSDGKFKAEEFARRRAMEGQRDIDGNEVNKKENVTPINKMFKTGGQ